MSKRRHLMILGVWAALLVLAITVFWDRLLPGNDDKLAPDGTGTERPEPPPAGGEPPEADTNSLLVRLHQALRAKNPDYNGRGQFRMAAGKITVADLSGTGIVDASPLKDLPLEALDLSENPIADLTALSGMRLTRLALEATQVTDLTPLQGMKLTGLYLNRTRVKDLTPLAGMPLELLNLYETEVADLAPLRGMPLKFLWLNATKVTDLSPLGRCPLVSLTLHETPVSDLSPLAGSTLKRLHIGNSAVTDLTPLEGMQLVRLIFTPAKIAKGMEVARGMKSIREIGLTLEKQMPPEQFWSLYDQGEFR